MSIIWCYLFGIVNHMLTVFSKYTSSDPMNIKCDQIFRKKQLCISYENIFHDISNDKDFLMCMLMFYSKHFVKFYIVWLSVKLYALIIGT
jgi:hypothetical protein